MPFRVSFRKQQKVGSKLAGWSENFWNNSSDLSTVETKSESLSSKLEALTGNEAWVSSYRISDLDKFRTAKNYATDFAGFGAGTRSADYPSVALLLKLQTPDPYTVRQWIRGVPDDVVGNGGVYLPGGVAGFTASMSKFLTELMSGVNGWCLRVLSGSFKKKPITAINLATGIVTCPGHNFSSTATVVNVRLQGFAVPKFLNKVWQITPIDANTFQLNFYTAAPGLTSAVANKPTARMQDYTLVPIQTAVIDRATSHYTGKPLDLLGGRRRTRRTTLVSVPAGV